MVVDFPKGYAQERQDFRLNEAERKLHYFLKEFFSNIYYKVVASIGYYLINKTFVHYLDKVQIGGSLQVSNHGVGNTAEINVLRTGGTEETVTPTPTGTVGGLNAYGYDGTNYAPSASIQFITTEPFGATTRGTYINFRTTPTGSATTGDSGFIAPSGSWASGRPSLATNASTGFLYIPTCAGVPTGTPESISGRIPLVADTSGGKIYAYLGGWIALN